MTSLSDFLRLLACNVGSARLLNGERILDASDFRQWLMELADLAEAADGKLDSLAWVWRTDHADKNN